MDRQPNATFPGAKAVVSCTYTAGHGISPGKAILRMLPQEKLPAGYGDLIMSDGVVTIPLRDCKVDEIRSITDDNGTEWQLEISDRRWKWRDFGSISGHYNRLDSNGKLIPWYIRSPRELAILCLIEMGEPIGDIDLPAGLEKAVGENINSLLIPGELFPPTGTNPVTLWDCEPPAAALQRLCDLYGRRIVFDPRSNRVGIVQQGFGEALPDGSWSSFAPSLKNPDTPIAVGIMGEANKYQGRFPFYAVGRDWNGVYKPIDALSFAPIFPASKQVVEVVFDVGSPTPNPATVFSLSASYTSPEGKLTSLETQRTLAAMGTANDIATGIRDDLLTSALAKYIDFEVAGGTLTLTAKDGFWEFDVSAQITSVAALNNKNASVQVRQTQVGHKGGPTWAFSPPPLFPGVRETDRLTLAQAQSLAQRHVWRDYQLSERDVSGNGSLLVPGYGRVKRKQQVVLLDTKVDQIVPTQADRTFTDRLGRPLIVNYYDGLSKDVPAQAFGGIAIYLTNGIVRPGVEQDGANTPPRSQILIDFSIDQEFQVASFSNHVYKLSNNGKIIEPEVVIETGVNVLDPVLNYPISYITKLILGGRAPQLLQKRPDVQLNITSEYDQDHRLLRTRIAEDDALKRANYYLEALAVQYRLSDSGDIGYNGFAPVNLDGYIQQVTWAFDASGIRTQASANSEHSYVVPPYPARRRIENLQPLQVERLERGGVVGGIIQTRDRP
jgi:hypothetical protein